jgi:hypothetical protein
MNTAKNTMTKEDKLDALRQNQEMLVKDRDKLLYRFRDMYDKNTVVEMIRKKYEELDREKKPNKRFFIEGYITGMEQVISNVVELEPSLKRY